MSLDENLKLTKEFDENLVEELIDADDEIISSDIISQNTVHDRFQFESKFDFDLNLDRNNDKNKRYYIDVYFFIPKRIGINSDTYTRENFYSDLTNYIRIRTPELFRWEQKNIDKWTLPWSEKYFKLHLSTKKRQKLSEISMYEVKLFGCFINTHIKKLQSVFSNLWKKETNEFAIYKKLLFLESRLESIYSLIVKYRENYTKKINERLVLIDDDVKKSFTITDEYISYRLEFVLVKILQILEKNKLKESSFYICISKILKKEVEYRITADFVNLESDDDKAILETYYHRMGLLKKYVLEVLYLQTENIKKEKIYRNFIAAVGAALAAAWAVMADIQRINLVNNTGDTGIRLLLVFFIGISAYVFKDRIKELSKEYFNQKLKQYIPDFEKKVFYDYFDKEGQLQKKIIAISQEYMRYLNRENIPEEIEYIRELGTQKDIESDKNEVIINYSKKISFDSDGIKDSVNKINFIRDISRFDISEFLDKLDDPDKTLRYFDNKKGIVVMKAPKVYHINVVIKYKIEHEKLNGTKVSDIEFERIRIVLNKKGIVRIDKILARGELKYTENV